MIKVSIIIPVYNVENYLSRCLESVIHQTFTDIEIICINDGSTDNSLQILQEYARKDERIVVINQENKGLAGARNAGLAIAKGEFISFVDPDDWIEPKTLETAMSLMSDDVDFVNFGINSCGEISEKQQKKENKLETINFTGKQKVTDKIILATQVYVCNKLFRKSIIDKYAIKFPIGLYYEDSVFTYTYLSVSKFGYYIQERYYNYFKNSNSIMSATKTTNNKKAIDHIHSIFKYFEFLKSNNLVESYCRLYEELFIHYLHLALKYSSYCTEEVLPIAENYAQLIIKSEICFVNSKIAKVAKQKSLEIKELKLKKYRIKHFLKNLFKHGGEVHVL